MLAESLGSYLEVPQTPSMLLYWLIFILYQRSARQNQRHQIVKHFDFDLTYDVIGDPGVTALGFRRQISQIYRTPLEFCKSDQ